MVKKLLIVEISLIVFFTGSIMADEIRIAVASNFIDAMKRITKHFQATTGDKVILVFGSTGKHFAQIKNGAPYDLFFAADRKRPEKLEAEGIAIPNSRFTYAIGRLILWSPKKDFVDSEGEVLQQNNFRYLAIASPKLAPYGRAALEVLRAKTLWERVRTNTVRGENIGQTFHFISSGNAELGFVAYSQILRFDIPVRGSWWIVPQNLYTPIEQQAVLLKNRRTARSFMTFVKGKESLRIIQSQGYNLP